MTVHLGYINWIMLSQLFKALNILFVLSATAAQMYPFDSKIDQTRYYHLISQVRCLVCQNESIGDSNAKLAEDLRAMIYTDIIAGKSDQQIITYLESRYGHFVSYEPPFNWSTLLIWLAPIPLALLTFFIFKHL